MHDVPFTLKNLITPIYALPDLSELEETSGSSLM